MRMRFLAMAAAVASAACSAATTTRDLAPSNTSTPVFGVTLTATVVGTSRGSDTVVVAIHNGGTAPRYVSRCGDAPLLLVEQNVNGKWTGGVQNFMCPAPSAPGPVEIAAGGTVNVTRVLDHGGTLAWIANIATKADLSDASRTLSNAVTAP